MTEQTSGESSPLEKGPSHSPWEVRMKFRIPGAISFLAVFVVLSFAGCKKEDKVVEETTAAQAMPPLSATSPRTSPHPADLPASVTISFASSTNWLDSIPAEERDDQVRDWTVLGLAGLLKIDAETLRNFSYDRMPVRDSLFAGIATEPVGPGRFLPDGSGTLHLLVPVNDPHAARTIGSLLDDYRKDSGSDPGSVRVHRYRIDYTKKTVAVKTGPARSPGDVRAENGYVSRWRSRIFPVWRIF